MHTTAELPRGTHLRGAQGLRGLLAAGGLRREEHQTLGVLLLAPAQVGGDGALRGKLPIE